MSALRSDRTRRRGKAFTVLAAGLRLAVLAAGIEIAAVRAPALGAEMKWQASLALTAVYDRNVYLASDDSVDKPRSSSGGSAAGQVGFTSASPRSELTFLYAPTYRFYSKEREASNLQHVAGLHWKTNLSERTTLTLGEDASYSNEADQLSSRVVDQSFTVGSRARQLRSQTSVGFSSRLSPRWTVNADYGYRILSNGAPKNDPAFATGACCVGSASGARCIVATEDECRSEDGAFQGRGTGCSASACTLGAPTVAVSTVTTALDEETHAGNVGASYQVSLDSRLGARIGFGYIRYEDDLFGDVVQHTNSVGASITYGWTAGERLSFNAALGGYRSRDSGGSGGVSIATIPGAVAVGVESKSTTEVSADINVSRNDPRGKLTAGLTRGLSSFDGLARVATVDANGDGTPDDSNGDGRPDLVVMPLGSSTRTTLYGAYNYRLGQRSNLDFAVNGTRSEETEGNGTLTTFGAGGIYGFRFAAWGGVQAGYTYTRQNTSGSSDLQGRGFTNNTALLGLFVSTPW